VAAPAEDVGRGAALLVVAALLFACAGAAVKQVSGSVSTEMVVFFRSALSLLPLLPFFLRAGVRGLATRCFHLHLVRALAGLTAMYCFFHAIARLHLAEAVVLNYSAPLFIPFVAHFWLRERVAPTVVWAAAIGFAGILLILKPGADLVSPAAVVGLAGGMLAALAFVGIRRLAEYEPTTRIVFYFSVVSTAVSAVPLAWVWQPPPASAWGLLLLIGLFAGAGQMAMTNAYAYAPAARIGPFSYATVVFAAVLGWMLWTEIPDALSFSGAALVCVAGVLATRGIAPAEPIVVSEPAVEPPKAATG
jgi:drug/metabolite transporter (DMT)-like permease